MNTITKQGGQIMENEKDLIILVDDNPANLRVGKNVLAEKYSVAAATIQIHTPGMHPRYDFLFF
jgi:response regulator RpfG family c-di-GMP phosphodiesterase